MSQDEMKVGELARRTGISVRTLHYYEEIGLLEPLRQISSGHRLYGRDELVRLQQILSLRQLGFSLEEIRDCLKRPDFSALKVIELHLGQLHEQLETTRRLSTRLETIAERLRAAEEVSAADFLKTIEETLMTEKYFTPEQMEKIKARGKAVGEERIAEGQREWQEVFDGFSAAMKQGTDPTDETVQALARRSRGLVLEFSGGDPGIHESLNKMYQEEPDIPNRHGMSVDPAVFEYMRRAGEILKQSS